MSITISYQIEFETVDVCFQIENPISSSVASRSNTSRRSIVAKRSVFSTRFHRPRACLRGIRRGCASSLQRCYTLILIRTRILGMHAADQYIPHRVMTPSTVGRHRRETQFHGGACTHTLYTSRLTFCTNLRKKINVQTGYVGHMIDVERTTKMRKPIESKRMLNTRKKKTELFVVFLQRGEEETRSR